VPGRPPPFDPRGGLKYTDNIWRLNFKLSGRGGLERLLYGGMDD
jgi:hypothetical protein